MALWRADLKQMLLAQNVSIELKLPVKSISDLRKPSKYSYGKNNVDMVLNIP